MKKWGLKRLTALVVAGVVMISSSGCGSKGEISTVGTEEGNVSGVSENSGAESSSYKAGERFYSEEPLTYSMLYSDHENYPYKSDWLLWEKIEELTNVTFELTTVARTDYVQKRSLLISSGEAPLIMPKTYAGQERQFVASGTILPISDYATEEYLPNYVKRVEEWSLESDLNSIRQNDGKYYLLPGIHESVGNDYTFVIRKDIFDGLGITIDDANYTYEQFYEDLLKVKAAYPDQYVISDRYQGNSLLKVVGSAFHVEAGWATEFTTAEKFDYDTEKFYFSPTTAEFKDFVTYLNKWIKAGILDPEFFTQDNETAEAKFTTGKSFVLSTLTQSTQDMKSKMNVGEEFELHQIVVPIGPRGAYVTETSRLENGIMISSNALDLGEEKFKELMNFIDWLWYSDEGWMLTKWGVEGVTFDLVDGEPVLKENIYYNGINEGAELKLNVDFGIANGVFMYGGSDEIKTSTFTDFEEDFYNRTVTNREIPKIDPPVMFDEDTVESMALISTPLMDYVRQMTNKFILGHADIEAEWDNYVAQCEALGSQTFIDTCNETYENTKQYLK